GIWNNGEFTAVGGSLSAEGGSKDIKTYSDIRVTGGSVRAVQNIIDGKFVNSIGDELECEAFDVFPSETVRTFENSEGDKYVYGLAPEDKASDGYYYVWKPVDFTPEFDGTVYIDDGSVTITADGITQGGKTFTWAEDIVISQKDRSTAFDVRISIESGTHNIIFDGVNINSSKGNCVDISSGASAAVSGSVKENIIASAQERAINNNGTLRINSGAFKLSGGYCGIYNASQTSVNGGRISVSGGVCDIFSEESGTLTVSGGSIKSENSAIGGKITNPSGDELECKVYSEYTGNLTFKDSDGNEYTYKLDIGDSIDGGYYVWQPKGVVPEGVEVSEENFPDPVFREYVLENFDTDSDGYLSDEEITWVTEVDVSSKGVSSLKGVEHLTALETLNCYLNRITSLDVSQNTVLKWLNCGETQITSLDVSNNVDLITLQCYNTPITSLDLSNNTALTRLLCYKTKMTSLDVRRNNLILLYCYNTPITNLDVSNNTALKTLYCQNTNISHVDITNTAVASFNASDCEHPITAVNGVFDTKTIDGLDHTRISDLQGAVIDENGVMSGIKEGTNITYQYDCGREYLPIFTLVPDENSTFDTEEVPFDGTLDLSAGPVTITEDGFVQNGVTTPWTGDYIITQGDGSSAITIESGKHNIILEDASISASGYGLTIAEGAEVTLSGSGTISGISVSGTLTADDCNIISEGRCGIYISGSGTVYIDSGNFDLWGSNNGIFCEGKLDISGGSVSANGENYGIMNSSNGVVSVSGGSVSISGGEDDIYSSGKLEVTGGSVKAENGTLIGSIVNADGAELECVVFDTFPSEAERTFTNPDGSEYLYKLTEGDRAEDGKYYVWKPKAVPKGVEVNEENFPDTVFREYVSYWIDRNRDEYLSEKEIAEATQITVPEECVSVQGIEYLVNLEMLEIVDTQVTSFDISNNIDLRYLCVGSSEIDVIAPIASIDVSNNINLNELYIYDTQITTLDISNNTALTSLDCCNSPITSLDISSNTELIELDCTGIQIASLDLSSNTALTKLGCSNTPITSLDLSNNMALTALYCRNTQITSLNVSNNTTLMWLECNDTQIRSLNVSNNKSLRVLKCYNTPITSLDLSQNTALTSLDCYNTPITNLDVNNNTSLHTLWCYDTKISYVDISNNPNIISFSASDCKHPITVVNSKFDTKTIDGFDHTRVSNLQGAVMDENGVLSGITEGTNITYRYDCGQGKSETFTLVPDENSTFDTEIPEGVAISAENFPDTVFRNYVSENFDTDGNGILSEEEIAEATFVNVRQKSDTTDGGVTSLRGIEYLTALESLYCQYNANLIEIDVSKNTALTRLSCGSTSITSLNVSNNTSLTYLSCPRTQIMFLDVSNNTDLTELECCNTQITSLDVRNNRFLTILNCSDTQITSLDVRNNRSLTDLVCSNTKITSLDISNNTALIDLNCSNTQIPYVDIRNTSVSNFYAIGCTYYIPSGLSFDITTDFNFSGFNPNNVSNVQGAEFSKENGIFYNFTSDTITYYYDCGRGFTETFTLVMTGGMMYSDFAYDDTFEEDFPEQVGEDDVPPQNTEQDNGGENVSEDVPEQEVIGEDIPADEPEQSIPDMLFDAVITTAASAAANMVDITIFAADIVIYLISILIKLWR
ncbi:MAG: carbohydrate-binding domain-containing protein, partial [Oscillospiraceae bacterium]|nr:carbohydrate-binding domain-containing protein [Oscillospiraceae bacterium]